jgi:hypothetical protein
VASNTPGKAVTIGPGALQSLPFQVPSTLEWLEVAPVKIFANYATPTNYDLVANSALPLAGQPPSEPPHSGFCSTSAVIPGRLSRLP